VPLLALTGVWQWAALLVIIPGLTSSKPLAIAAAVVWGIVMGTHETIMKSAIADITPMKKRGTGYGIFNAAYGLAVVIAVAIEVAALVVFVFLRKVALKKIEA
jgi:MFS family permease